MNIKERTKLLKEALQQEDPKAIIKGVKIHENGRASYHTDRQIGGQVATEFDSICPDTVSQKLDD